MFLRINATDQADLDEIMTTARSCQSLEALPEYIHKQRSAGEND
jgi:hypothetical protein